MTASQPAARSPFARGWGLAPSRVSSRRTVAATSIEASHMDHREALLEAVRLLGERGAGYDQGAENSFPRAAAIASLKLDRRVTPYEVAIILESVKDARRATDPSTADHHIDGINYKAFGLEYIEDHLRAQEEQWTLPFPPSSSTSASPSSEPSPASSATPSSPPPKSPISTSGYGSSKTSLDGSES